MASTPSASTKAPSYPIGSVDNALRLLLLFRERGVIRVTDASEELGVARSTAHRLMEMLAYHGFVRHADASRAYVAGSALLDIGLSVVRHLDIRSVARPFLEELRDATRETVHLAQLELPNVRFLDCVESARVVRVGSHVGQMVPAHCTSVGKVLLATSPPDVVDRYLDARRRLPGLTPHSITTRRELLEQLAGVRARGYALNSEESELGLGSIGVAILTPTGRPVAAISVAAPVRRGEATDFASFVARTVAAAQAVAERIG